MGAVKFLDLPDQLTGGVLDPLFSSSACHKGVEDDKRPLLNSFKQITQTIPLYRLLITIG